MGQTAPYALLSSRLIATLYSTLGHLLYLLTCAAETAERFYIRFNNQRPSWMRFSPRQQMLTAPSLRWLSDQGLDLLRGPPPVAHVRVIESRVSSPSQLPPQAFVSLLKLCVDLDIDDELWTALTKSDLAALLPPLLPTTIDGTKKRESAEVVTLVRS